MKIRVERSGGFAGINLSKEIDAKDLPSDMIATAEKFLLDPSKSTLRHNTARISWADGFTYRISIDDGINHKVVECAENDMSGDMKILVKFIEKHSNKHH